MIGAQKITVFIKLQNQLLKQKLVSSKKVAEKE